MTARQVYVLRFWEEMCCPSPTTSLRSAIAGGLLNCLSLEETLSIAVHDAQTDRRLREKVLKRLLEELKVTSLDVRKSVGKMLLSALVDAPRKSALAYYLEHLYDSMPRSTQKRIVDALLQIPQATMRNRAYRLLRNDWRSEWNEAVQLCWEKWHEPACALVIVDNFDPTFLVQQIGPLSGDLNNGAHLARLYVRACAIEVGLLTQLRKLDGITYVYVSARLGKSISTRMARRLLNEYQYDDRLGILAWGLGKLGHWKLLTELSSKIDNLEREIHRQTLANWGIAD